MRTDVGLSNHQHLLSVGLIIRHLKKSVLQLRWIVCNEFDVVCMPLQLYFIWPLFVSMCVIRRGACDVSTLVTQPSLSDSLTSAAI